MANRRLWHTIVEAMRAAKIREPERSATREILGETPPVGVAEKLQPVPTWSELLRSSEQEDVRA